MKLAYDAIVDNGEDLLAKIAEVPGEIPNMPGIFQKF